MTKFSEIAKSEAKKYYDYPNIIGILWIGSSSFGIEDDLADIDIRILVNNREKSQPMKQYEVSGIKVEVDEMSWDWLFSDTNLDSEQSWIIEKSVILFDFEGKVTKTLTKARTRLSETDNKKMLWENYAKLFCDYDLKKSLKRDQLLTSHIILSTFLDSLSKFIFLYKHHAVPPQKWRWFLIRKEKLFDLNNIDKLVELDPKTSFAEILSIIKNIQLNCQSIMLGLGFEKEKVSEPWKF